MRTINFLLISVNIVFWASCKGQSIVNTVDTFPVPYFTSILVQDIDASVDWYSKLLYLEERDRKVLPERGIEIVNLLNDKFHLELIEMSNILLRNEVLVGEKENYQIGGLFKIGFFVKAFDNQIQLIENLKIDTQGSIVTDPVSGKRMIIALDPDGNRIQFFGK